MTTLLQYFQIKTQRNVAIIEAKCPIPSSQWLDLRWDLGASGGQEEPWERGFAFNEGANGRKAMKMEIYSIISTLIFMRNEPLDGVDGRTTE